MVLLRPKFCQVMTWKRTKIMLHRILQHQHKSWQFVWWCRYLLDVLHEQEKLKTVLKTAVIGGGELGDAMEATEAGAMTRWTTEEDLSTENVLHCKACSLADCTQGERIGICFHLFGLILSVCLKECSCNLDISINSLALKDAYAASHGVRCPLMQHVLGNYGHYCTALLGCFCHH
jgi:hypothetical protein